MLPLLLAAILYLPPNPTVSPLWNDWKGGFWNVGTSEQADTNAIAHVWGGVACTLTGYYLGNKLAHDGRKGALYGALACTGLVVARLFLVHAPRAPAPGYGAEMRAGVVTGLGSIWLTAAPLLLW